MYTYTYVHVRSLERVLKKQCFSTYSNIFVFTTYSIAIQSKVSAKNRSFLIKLAK